jgi:hypothetical protein
LEEEELYFVRGKQVDVASAGQFVQMFQPSASVSAKAFRGAVIKVDGVVVSRPVFLVSEEEVSSEVDCFGELNWIEALLGEVVQEWAVALGRVAYLNRCRLDEQALVSVQFLQCVGIQKELISMRLGHWLLQS